MEFLLYTAALMCLCVAGFAIAHTMEIVKRLKISNGFSLTRTLNNGEQVMFTANFTKEDSFDEMEDKLRVLHVVGQNHHNYVWQKIQEMAKEQEEEQKRLFNSEKKETPFQS